MSPFVEPRFQPIGNTFLVAGAEDDEPLSCGSLRRRRSNSFSHISYAHGVQVHLRLPIRAVAAVTSKAAGGCWYSCGSDGGGDDTTSVASLASSSSLSTATGTPSTVSSSASTACSWPQEAEKRSAASAASGLAPSSRCGPGSHEGGSQDSIATEAPRVAKASIAPVKKDLVRQLRCTGKSAMLRAAAMARELQVAGK